MARVLTTQDVFDLNRIGTGVKSERFGVRVDADSQIQLQTPGATVRLHLSDNDKGPPLRPGDVVYVWWHAGGFVCAPVDEVNEAESHRLVMKEEVRRAREKLAQARRDRDERYPRPPESPPRDTQFSMWDAFS
jgi:hypothetical protein